jgi:hypothetical protein
LSRELAPAVWDGEGDGVLALGAAADVVGGLELVWPELGRAACLVGFAQLRLNRIKDIIEFF